MVGDARPMGRLTLGRHSLNSSLRHREQRHCDHRWRLRGGDSMERICPRRKSRSRQLAAVLLPLRLPLNLLYVRPFNA